MESNIKYLKLNDIETYKISFNLSNIIWEMILKWKQFEKDTVGKQFVRSIDSISANIADGFGRYHKKDKIKFYRYSYGSIFESLDWNEKTRKRNLITKEQYNHIFTELQKLPKSLHHLINFTNEKLKV